MTNTGASNCMLIDGNQPADCKTSMGFGQANLEAESSGCVDNIVSNDNACGVGTGQCSPDLATCGYPGPQNTVPNDCSYCTKAVACCQAVYTTALPCNSVNNDAKNCAQATLVMYTSNASCLARLHVLHAMSPCTPECM